MMNWLNLSILVPNQHHLQDAADQLRTGVPTDTTVHSTSFEIFVAKLMCPNYGYPNQILTLKLLISLGLLSVSASEALQRNVYTKSGFWKVPIWHIFSTEFFHTVPQTQNCKRFTKMENDTFIRCDQFPWAKMNYPNFIRGSNSFPFSPLPHSPFFSKKKRVRFWRKPAIQPRRLRCSSLGPLQDIHKVINQEHVFMDTKSRPAGNGSPESQTKCCVIF